MWSESSRDQTLTRSMRARQTHSPLLDLHDSYAVLSRVDEPGPPGKPDIGDAVDGLVTRQVVILDVHAAPAELGDLAAEVGNAKSRLGLVVFGAHRALADCEVAFAATFERDRVR